MQAMHALVAPNKHERHLYFGGSNRVLWSFVSFLICSWMLCSKHMRADEVAKWPVELQIEQFEIHCDFELPAPERLASELSRIGDDLKQLLEIQPSKKKIHIVLLENATEYSRYMENYFPNLPKRRALFIQDRGPGMLFTYWHQELAIDLRHEITHALLNDAVGRLPLWLDEGLAEYVEVEKDQRYSQHEYLNIIADRSDKGWVPALEQLEKITDLSNFGDSQYRASWSWVHFLLHRSPDTRRVLINYLNGSKSGSEQLPLSRQLQLLDTSSGQGLEDQFREHFSKIAHFSKLANASAVQNSTTTR